MRDVEEFTVKPRRQDADAVREERTFPSLPWSAEDLQALVTRLEGAKQEPTVLAMLDLATGADDRRVTWEDVVTRSGRSSDQVRSDLAHLTMITKADFGRENWPATVNWRAGVLSYLIDEPTAEAWQQVRHEPATPQAATTDADDN